MFCEAPCAAQKRIFTSSTPSSPGPRQYVQTMVWRGLTTDSVPHSFRYIQKVVLTLDLGMLQSLCHLLGASQASMVQLTQAKSRFLHVVPLAFQDLDCLAFRPPCTGLGGPPFPQLTAAAPRTTVCCVCRYLGEVVSLPSKLAPPLALLSPPWGPRLSGRSLS